GRGAQGVRGDLFPTCFAPPTGDLLGGNDCAAIGTGDRAHQCALDEIVQRFSRKSVPEFERKGPPSRPSSAAPVCTRRPPPTHVQNASWAPSSPATGLAKEVAYSGRWTPSRSGSAGVPLSLLSGPSGSDLSSAAKTMRVAARIWRLVRKKA